MNFYFKIQKKPKNKRTRKGSGRFMLQATTLYI